MKHIEQLMLTVGLVDEATKPIQGINDQIRQTGEIGRRSMERIVGGVAGLVASGAALYAALQPAIEMDDTLAEVKSLGVVQEDLELLRKTARQFSVEFGESATEFVGSAYDIKSAMGEMTGKELAGITKASAVLAKGTKADTQTITSYMGTMYGIFKAHADAIGKDNFAALVAGQTAQAVESFKTTGAEMSAAFSSVGADATAVGVGMAEQMAVLGTLQATMSGAEAGTKYRAFLAGIAKAQGELNMKMVDGNGNALGMVAILQKLKDKFGDTLTVADSDALKKAFGSNQAVALIKQMLPDIDGLAASINNVGQQTGMDKATKMAQDMTSQFDRLTQAFWAVREGAGNSILPTIIGVTAAMADGVGLVAEWTEMFPHLTEVVTWAVVGIGSLTAAMAVWSIVAGIAGLAMGAVSWPLLAIAAAIGAIILLWDPLSTFFNGFISTLAPALSDVFEPFGDILRVIGAGVEWLVSLFGLAKKPLDDMGASFVTMQGLGAAAGTIVGTIFKILLSPLWAAGKAVQWVLDKLNLIPGVNIDVSSSELSLPDVPDMPAITQDVEYKRNLDDALSAQKNNSINRQLSAARATESIKARPAPLLPQVAKAASQSGGKMVSFGDVHIKSEQGMSPQDLAEWEELQHGF